MSALQRPFRYKRLRVWQIIFCLTVLAFLFRSAIAVGYMPEVSGGRDGGFTITLCTTSGPAVMQVDPAGNATPTTNDTIDSQDCPYGLLASQEALPDYYAVAPASTIAYLRLALAHVYQPRPPLPALGPPLGPRAPPFHLG